MAFFRSIRHAFRGLKTVFETENNFRIHTIIAVLVIALGIYRDLSKNLWIALLLVIAFILSLEIFNSAIERLVDMLTPKTHSFAKEIKDLVAGIVLLASLFAIVIGLIIFL